MSTDQELAGSTALVTGSSRGIGRAIAASLAAHGARVALHGRDRDALEAVAAALRSAGAADPVVVTGDLVGPDGPAAVVTAAEQALGRIDVLVANAGGSPSRPQPIEDTTDEDFVAAVELNLTATYRLLHAALPAMKARGAGAVVTVSSAASRRPSAQSPFAYAAAKAGVELLTRTAALQAGPAGVRVNCVSPETILTEKNLEMIPPDVQERLVEQHPVRRLGTPEDVAEAVLYLVSPRSSWVSGVVLDVAGGSVLA